MKQNIVQNRPHIYGYLIYYKVVNAEKWGEIFLPKNSGESMDDSENMSHYLYLTLPSNKLKMGCWPK